MRKWYSTNLLFVLCTGLMMALLSGLSVQAQTTITTLPNPPYNGGNGLGGPANISFVLNNTNPYPIRITGIANYCETFDNGGIWELYANSVTLSGTTTDVTAAPWTLAATSLATTVSAAGITPINFPTLSYVVPANTQIRFALRDLGPGTLRYSGTGLGITPNSFTADGVTLLVGDQQIAGQNVGYSGTGTGLTLTPRFFTGSVTFEPFGPCPNPPTTGVPTPSASTVCLNSPFSINLIGGTGGTGQTFQWQSSPDNTNWTNIAGATASSYSGSQSVTTWYRCVVTCGVTVNSPGVQVFTPAAVSGTFPINSALPTNPGVTFQSFNDAYDYIKCGINGPVVFNVDPASGPYTEQLRMTAVPGASATNTITFNGNGRTIQFLSTNTTERAVIKLNGADHIRFNNLNIKALGTQTTEFGFGVHIINDADSNVISNCSIDLVNNLLSANYAGIVINSSNTSPTGPGASLCDANIITGNTINGGYLGISCVGSNTDANRFNVISGNQILDFYQYGVYVGGNFNTSIDSNFLSRPTRNIFPTSSSSAVFLTQLNILVTATRNTVTNMFGGLPTSTSTLNAFMINASDALGGFENRFVNNRIYNVGGSGEISAFNCTGSDNVFFQHNTALLDGSAGNVITRGFFQTIVSAGIRFENNIIAITRSGPGAKYGIYYNTATSDVFANKNDYYLSSPDGNQFVGFFTPNQQLSLANWQAASGDDANSVTQNPVFADVASGNLRPTNANIDNLGDPLGITIDFTGAPRSNLTPDIGAYEFTPGNCVSPPTPGTALVTPVQVCFNAAASLSLTGNSLGLGQTYQWQTGPTAVGPFTSIGNILTNPDTSILGSVTQFYRVAVTCGGNTTFSDPVFLTVDPPLPGGTYTIDRNTPTGGTNYNTFADFIFGLRCGLGGNVTVNVVPNSGPYTEQVILDSVGGMNQYWIQFNGNGNTISFAPLDNTERATVKLRRADRVTFDNFTIESIGTNGFGYAVQLFNDADSNTIRNCRILADLQGASASFAGIVVSASETSATTFGTTHCDDNVFDSNNIKGGFYGITLMGYAAFGGGIPIQNNKIIKNLIEDFYSTGIQTGGTNNTLIEANTLQRISRPTVGPFFGINVVSAGLTTNLWINRNKIANPFEGSPSSTNAFGGIYFNGGDGESNGWNLVTNNLIYNVNGDGTQYGIYNSGSNYVRFYHNTISLQDQNQTSANNTFGFYSQGITDSVVFRNNLIAVTRQGGSGSKYGLGIQNLGNITWISDNNNIFTSGSNSYFGTDGANRLTVQDWRASNGQDQNTVTFDPLFANPAAGIFQPLFPGMDNLGIPVGITNDINNAPRSTTTPDIGAYEFVVPPCTAPPAVGSATATPNSGICIETPVLLTIGGYQFGSGQTYQWEFSTSATGPWSSLGGPRLFPDTTILASQSLYYRCLVTCNGNTAISGTAQVTLNAAFLGGVYTINRALPPTLPNFTSFAAAVAAMDCGITDDVFFDVAPDTYNEQIRIGRIRGSGNDARVTFRSANGDPASVILTTNASLTGLNYTLQLDSTSYTTFKNMTINQEDATFGRVVEFRRTASYDSLLNCRINSQPSTQTNNIMAAVYADSLTGRFNVIKGNTIRNGSQGIFWEGTNNAALSYDHTIDSNDVAGSYQAGIALGFNGRVRVTKNLVNISSPRSAINYGIYATANDTALRYIGNRVNMTNLIENGSSYGIYFTGCDGRLNDNGLITQNVVMGTQGNASNIYGLYFTGGSFVSIKNNISNISTTGNISYATYTTGGSVEFFNNSAHNSSTGTGPNNYAAYFGPSGAGGNPLDSRNNVFSHTASGKAMFVTTPNNLYSDYNMFYSNGPTLIQWGNALQFPTLKAWIDTSYWDLSSIAYQPAWNTAGELQPDLTSPEVWAMHGRGTQIVGNDFDYNNNPRPTTYTAGVPDLGAYEFLPTSLPTVLTPTPAVPAPGITQTFMYGTDTVAKITYDPVAPVPASISLRRYSGVLPTGLSAGQQSMYFYTQAEVPAQGAYKYKFDQYYIEPWQGFIPSEPQNKLGRTDASNTWVSDAGSVVLLDENILSDTNLVHIDRFTGLAGDSIQTQAPPYVTVIDTSNAGTRFWVPYGHHYSFNTNGQDMWLYLSATDSANVTVKINGTPWKRTYAIPANTVRVSDIIPKFGLIDARITNEGLYNRGISITSDVPIVAYAHIYDGATSGASLLLPVGVYGYEYQSLNSRQYYPTGGAGSFSWVAVMTDRDSTLVEITPAVQTRAGRPAGVPFTVYLNRGQVYNIMGTQTSPGGGTDLSGTLVRSIANANGKCYPIAVFSGSSRTAICNTTNGDNLIQQVFPRQAWGRKYLSFATANTNSNTQYNSNIFRIMVKDPTTVVNFNGATLPQASLVVPGLYYEVSTTSGNGPNGAVYFEADKPVMVAQYMVSTGAGQCAGVTATGNGDPEMIYISPIEQGIKEAAFYNTNESAITANYVNILIPTAGLLSLTIDGATTFTDVFAHPFLTGYSCVRQNFGGGAGQHVVRSDSAFTAITYGLGSVESYGYNAGTLVKNLAALPSITNTLGTDSVSNYTCVNAPFRFNIYITAKPQQLTWNFSEIATLTPNTDVTQANPQPIDSLFQNGRWYYKYTVASDYIFNEPGTFYIPILVKDTSTIEGCENTQEVILEVRVLPAPIVDFSTVTSSCFGAPITFNGTGSTVNNTPINSWTWDFGNSTTATGQNTTYTYPAPGNYNVMLTIISEDGCIADTTKPIEINTIPAVAVVEDTLVVCGNDPVTFDVENPDATSTYNWYTTATGGTPVFTGPSYTVPSVTGTVEFWVEASSAAGCISERTRVQASILPNLPTPVVRLDSAFATQLRFSWDAVPGAVSYEVSTDNGATWITPSSGSTGLFHYVTGLLPLQTVNLIVRANGAVSCQQAISAPVEGKTLPGQIYIPNAFTPNGDGLNDIFLIYGYTIANLRFTVFNQWGEKVFESFNQTTGWDGRYKGKPQPSGVYMYVCQITLRDGTTEVRKGSINLIR